MKKLNTRIRLLFGFALALSIGFPLGVLGIIFGATKGMVAMLVVGIVLTVCGFYGMPLLWVGYGSRRQDRVLLHLIGQEHLLSVAELAVQTGYAEEDVRTRLKWLLSHGMLTGYVFRDDALVLNEHTKQKSLPSKNCPRCGGGMTILSGGYLCEYCDYKELA